MGGEGEGEGEGERREGVVVRDLQDWEVVMEERRGGAVPLFSPPSFV